MSQEGFILIDLLELWHGGTGEPLALCSGPTGTVRVTSYEWYDLTLSVTRDYIPFGFKIGSISRNIENMTPVLGIDIALTDELLDLLAANDIRSMTLVLKSYEHGVSLTNPNDIDLYYIGRIEEWSEKNIVLALTCKDSTINYWMKNPKRQYSYQCGHPFKRHKCGYTGPETTCAKTLLECTNYGNNSHYGGFPEIWRQMRSAI